MRKAWLLALGAPAIAASTACGRSDLSPDIGGAGGAANAVHSAFGETMVALGEEHTCVRRVFGDVLCFGKNEVGQLGVSGIASSPTPVAVKLPGLAKAVYSGRFHTCAVLTDDSAYCWGANESGEVGVTPSMSEPSPVKVPIPNGVVLKMSLGRAHTCILQRDKDSEGTLYCWGSNDHGQ